MADFKIWRSSQSQPEGSWDSVTWVLDGHQCFADALAQIVGLHNVHFLHTHRLNDANNRLYRTRNGSYYFQVRKL